MKAAGVVFTVVVTGAAYADEVEISGRVVDVFGSRFVLEAQDQTYLVTLPTALPRPAPGRFVTVSGERSDTQVVAEKLQFLASPQASPSVSVTSADKAIPAPLRDLDLQIVNERLWGHGKREIWVRLNDGARFEANIDADGVVRDVEARGHRAVLPDVLVERLIPGALGTYPVLSDLRGIRTIKISTDGSVELEGFSASGEEIKAELNGAGHLVEIKAH